MARELAQVCELVADADSRGRPVLVLGAGSNVVVGDSGFDGLVLRVALQGVEVRADGAEAVVRVAAGTDWSGLVELCLAEGLAGVECLAGIPGLVGATPVQNVGAYGQEVGEVIEAVGAWDRWERRLVELAGAECGFGYRDSVFKKQARYVVTEVALRLQRSATAMPLRYAELARRLDSTLGARPGAVEVARAVLALRRSKGMVLDAADPDSRSAGSFFVNPVLRPQELARLDAVLPGAPRFDTPAGAKIPAAWLVEAAGFHRGYRHGRAAISSKHALAITALEGATAGDVLGLARAVRDGVLRLTGIRLDPEPLLVNASL